MLVAVLSDTHAPRRWTSCPPAVATRLEGVDLILHAGDVSTPDVLDELSAGSPTDRRRQPHGTMGLLTLRAGELLSAVIVPVT